MQEREREQFIIIWLHDLSERGKKVEIPFRVTGKTQMCLQGHVNVQII